MSKFLLHASSETIAEPAIGLNNPFISLSTLHQNIHRTSTVHTRHVGANDIFTTASDSHIRKQFQRIVSTNP